MKSIYVGKGLPCPKCKELMHTKKHPIITEKELSKLYYYSQWDVCFKCKHVQHYDKYKVYSKDMNIYLESKRQEQQLLDFLK